MSGYSHINLSDMLHQLGDDKVKSILSSYSCPLNKDVEYFLHEKAIEFAKQGIAATHLVFTSYKGKHVLIGYFSVQMLKCIRSNERSQADTEVAVALF